MFFYLLLHVCVGLSMFLLTTSSNFYSIKSALLGWYHRSFSFNPMSAFFLYQCHSPARPVPGFHVRHAFTLTFLIPLTKNWWKLFNR